jgi:nitrite reductase/ring-hydroxylating ferredoxin subunit
MLSKEENERITRVGPGTPMGKLMRRYWMPACLAEELPEPDCPPVRVRLLGEDLVAFRDTQGRIGLLDEFCPHRLASLFLGRNEECGLRCVYHGWKFDVTGQCVDMPNEPPEYRFESKIRLTAYPAFEHAGLIWAYLGPADKQPPLPDMEWMRAPATHRFVSRTREEANYLQAIEGGIDSVHSSFLHNNNLADKDLYRTIGSSARLEVERTDYGFRYASMRDVGEDGQYVRMYQFVVPFYQMRASMLEGRKGARPAKIPQLRGHMWVPMDDHNTMVYNYTTSIDADKPLSPEYIEQQERNLGRGPGGENVERTRTRANNWLIDRQMQKTVNFTGIPGVNTQDLAVQESMGPIVDRSREHLGSTDRAIITCRRVLLEAIGDIEEGVDPLGLDPRVYRDVRPAETILPPGASWREVADKLLVAGR